jgi:RNA polymerase-binding protein DksA
LSPNDLGTFRKIPFATSSSPPWDLTTACIHQYADRRALLGSFSAFDPSQTSGRICYGNRRIMTLPFDLDLPSAHLYFLAVVTHTVHWLRIVGRDHSLQCNWMQRDMHEELAKALKRRLAELRTHLAKVDRELNKPLPADSEEQAVELENQEALEVIEKTEITEIHQIEAALKRISEGTYGTCAKCGEPIDPRRLKTLPTAATCISCST